MPISRAFQLGLCITFASTSKFRGRLVVDSRRHARSEPDLLGFQARDCGHIGVRRNAVSDTRSANAAAHTTRLTAHSKH